MGAVTPSVGCVSRGESAVTCSEACATQTHSSLLSPVTYLLIDKLPLSLFSSLHLLTLLSSVWCHFRKAQHAPPKNKPRYLINALTPLLPLSVSSTSLSLLPPPSVPVFLFRIFCCLYFCLSSFLFFSYKELLSTMNLSKWMSWRRRNFFRRKGNHESSLDLGKWGSWSVRETKPCLTFCSARALLYQKPPNVALVSSWK